MSLASFRLWVLRTLTPFTKWFGSLHAPASVKLITEIDCREIKRIIRPGMVLLTHTIGAASNVLLAGDFWKHAAIYVDNNTVMEATSKGVVRTDLDFFLCSKDYVVVLMPTFAPIIEMYAAARWAEAQAGKPYDYEFKEGWDAFYCSELATDSYAVSTGTNCPFVRHEIFGVNSVKPQDFRNAKSKWCQQYLSEAARNLPAAA